MNSNNFMKCLQSAGELFQVEKFAFVDSKGRC